MKLDLRRFLARFTVVASGLTLLAFGGLLVTAETGDASVNPSNAPRLSAEASPASASSLESVTTKALDMGRKVALSLIGLGLALAGIVLAFRRDFKEAIGVFAVGLVAVLLVTPAGVSLLHDTVNSLLGSQ